LKGYSIWTLARNHQESTEFRLQSPRAVSFANMSDRFIPEHRRNNYKASNTFKPDELRRRREEQQVEIRKAKREENLAKRRGIAGRDGGVAVGGLGSAAAPDSDDEGGNIEGQVSGTSLSIGLANAFDAS
jgi:hypothetical protein